MSQQAVIEAKTTRHSVVEGRALERFMWERARRCSSGLAEYAFKDEEGQRFRLAGFQQEWHDRWTGLDNDIAIGPRGHGKTENLTAHILWRLGQNPNLRIKYISAEPDLATRVVSVVGQHIEKNPALRQVFRDLRPDKANEWSKHALFVRREFISKEPSLEAWGVFQGTSGGRCDLLFFDDVCNWRNSLGQPALREKVKISVRDNWMKFLTPKGKAVYINTPWSTGDLTAEFSSSTLWRLWKKPAMDEDTGQYLWPERFPPGYFEKLLADPKEAPSARRQFLLQAIADEDTLFPSSVVDGMFFSAATGREHAGAIGFVAGIDPARSLSETASYTVMVTAAVMPNGERILLDIWRMRLQPVPSWEKMLATWRNWHHNIVLVENNAYQESAVDYLKRAEPTASQAIIPFTTGRQKADEQIGLPGLAGRLPLWLIPMNDGDHAEGICQCAKCQLRAELKAYPFGDYSDCVMALWFADTAAERLLLRGRTHGEAAVGGSRTFQQTGRMIRR